MRERKPGVLVIDSIQTAFDPELAGAPGSVGQVRACTARLMRVAKDLGVTTLHRRPRHQGRRHRGPARARAHGRRGAVLRGRPRPRVPHRARGQEPVRLVERDRHLRDGRARARRRGVAVGGAAVRARRGRLRLGGHGGDGGLAPAARRDPGARDARATCRRRGGSRPASRPRACCRCSPCSSAGPGSRSRARTCYVSVAGGLRVTRAGRRPAARACAGLGAQGRARSRATSRPSASSGSPVRCARSRRRARASRRRRGSGCSACWASRRRRSTRRRRGALGRASRRSARRCGCSASAALGRQSERSGTVTRRAESWQNRSRRRRDRTGAQVIDPKTRELLREELKKVAPGTHLREGLDMILAARTGALIVIGDEAGVEGAVQRRLHHRHAVHAAAPLRARQDGRRDHPRPVRGAHHARERAPAARPVAAHDRDRHAPPHRRAREPADQGARDLGLPAPRGRQPLPARTPHHPRGHRGHARQGEPGAPDAPELPRPSRRGARPADAPRVRRPGHARRRGRGDRALRDGAPRVARGRAATSCSSAPRGVSCGCRPTSSRRASTSSTRCSCATTPTTPRSRNAAAVRDAAARPAAGPPARARGGRARTRVSPPADRAEQHLRPRGYRVLAQIPALPATVVNRIVERFGSLPVDGARDRRRSSTTSTASALAGRKAIANGLAPHSRSRRPVEPPIPSASVASRL